MSFLPHGASKGWSWYGSLTTSALVHGAIVGFFMFSGVVAFLPEPEETAVRAPEFSVTLEILDADIVEETEVIDEAGIVPPDAEPLAPDELIPETQPDELAALAPDDQTLVPEEDSAVSPEADEVLQPEAETTLPDAEEPAELATEALEPETTELAEPEAEPVAPEVVEPEPVEPEVLAPEIIEPEVAEPETIDPEPVEPEITEPEIAEVAPEPEPEPVPVAPEPAQPTPLAIDGLSPVDDTVLSPLAEGGAGPAPELGLEEDDVLALVTPEPIPVPQDNAPEQTDPEIVALPLPIEPEVTDPEVTAPVITEQEPAPEPEEPNVADTPEAPAETGGDTGADTQTQQAAATRPLPNPTASDIAIGQLIRRIRTVQQPQCTLALPRRAGGTPGAGVSFVGADPDVLNTLAAQIVEGLEFEPVQTREEIDLRQCATLDALRQSDSYPANRIGLSLDNTSLVSGDALTGRVIGAEGLFVTLLLVDDNGVVQDMAPFVTIDGTTPVFNAPVARAGPTRATRQILLALGTQGAPIDLSDQIGNEAQAVFSSIPADTLSAMVFGVATFDVR